MIDTSLIKESIDKPLIEESIKLFENGFYRSSYIMAWLAGVESLRRRFEAGSHISPSLKIIYDTIKQTEGSKKSIDYYVIEKAKDSFMISDVEYQKLEYFYRMRCIFSHPYEQTPLANDCEHIIKSIISIILSKDILLGKDTIDSIIAKIEKEQSYLEDDKEKISNFFKEILVKTDPSLFLGILQDLSSFYETYIPGNLHTDIIKPRVEVCIKTLTELRPIDYFFKDDQEKETFIYANKKSASYIFSQPDVLRNVSEHIQDIIMIELTSSRSSEYIANIYNSDLEISETISEKCENYIQTLVNSNDLAHFNAEKIILRLIKLLKSGDFNLQNEVPYLFKQRNFLETLRNCSKTDLKDLGRNILQASYGYPTNHLCSNDCYYLICNYDTKFLYPNALLEGFILELFVKEDYTLRPKLDMLNTINDLLGKLDVNQKNKLLKLVENEINNSVTTRNHADWSPLASASEFVNINTVVQNKLQQLNYIP